MRKLLYALTIVGLLAAGVYAQQAGGAFFPGFNYTIPANWAFTGTNTHTGTETFSGTSTLSGTVTLTAPTLNQPLTTTSVGTKNGSTVTVVERGTGVLHQTVFTLTATPLTIRDTETGGGVKIYDFPEGVITILGASGSVAGTTTSTLASTLHAGSTYNWGVGTVTQANGTLATTEQDLIPTTNGTSSATINVAGAASAAARTAAPVQFDGHSSAKSAYFNVGIASGAAIDADASTTWTGTVTITWMFNGDV